MFCRGRDGQKLFRSVRRAEEGDLGRSLNSASWSMDRCKGSLRLAALNPYRGRYDRRHEPSGAHAWIQWFVLLSAFPDSSATAVNNDVTNGLWRAAGCAAAHD